MSTSIRCTSFGSSEKMYLREWLIHIGCSVNSFLSSLTFSPKAKAFIQSSLRSLPTRASCQHLYSSLYYPWRSQYLSFHSMALDFPNMCWTFLPWFPSTTLTLMLSFSLRLHIKPTNSSLIPFYTDFIHYNIPSSWEKCNS